MAERRMMAKTIINSDAFLDMPCTTQLLYFHFCMRADDDGFINNAKSIMRLCGAKDDDIKLLCAKKFILVFEEGIIVVKHWRIHNYIAKDRYTETKYKELKATLKLDGNGSYTDRIQVVDECETQVRLGKDRIGEERKERSPDASASSPPRFKKPDLEDVSAYCQERSNGVDPAKWLAHYESNGWRVGKNPMKDWKAAVRTWEPAGFRAPRREVVKVCPHCGAKEVDGLCRNPDCPQYDEAFRGGKSAGGGE